MDGSDPKPFKMRAPCLKCSCETGYIKEAGTQDVVRCTECDKFAYNAPRTETGKAVRNTQTVHAAIKPKLRSRILERANGRCEVCGKGPESGCVMHVGHVLSVDQGLTQGMTELELNDEENLISLCDECNLGAGKSTVPIRLLMRILWARVNRKFSE